MKRKRYVINWRYQLKYAVFLIVPMVLLGLFVTTIGFKTASEMIVSQKRQLMFQISTLEECLRDINAAVLTKANVEKLVDTVNNIKDFSQDLIAINAMEFRSLINMILLAIIVVITGAILLGIFVSHRVAGPVFNLRRCIREMTKTIKTTPVKIRRGDEFQDLASDLEELRKAIVSSHFLRKDSIVKLTKVLGRIEESISKSAVDKGDLEELKAEIVKLESIC